MQDNQPFKLNTLFLHIFQGVRYFPKGIFPRAISQGQLHKCAISQVATSKGQIRPSEASQAAMEGRALRLELTWDLDSTQSNSHSSFIKFKLLKETIIHRKSVLSFKIYCSFFSVFKYIYHKLKKSTGLKGVFRKKERGYRQAIFLLFLPLKQSPPESQICHICRQTIINNVYKELEFL